MALPDNHASGCTACYEWFAKRDTAERHMETALRREVSNAGANEHFLAFQSNALMVVDSWTGELRVPQRIIALSTEGTICLT